MLVPHEVQSLLDLGDHAGTLSAEVSSGASLQVVGVLLNSDKTQNPPEGLVGVII